MPKVPERKLSYGENLEKIRKLNKRGIAPYPTFEEPKGKNNGPVKVTKH